MLLNVDWIAERISDESGFGISFGPELASAWETKSYKFMEIVGIHGEEGLI